MNRSGGHPGKLRLTVRGALTALLTVTLLPMLIGGPLVLYTQWQSEQAKARLQLQAQARTLVAATDREFAVVVGRLKSASASELIEKRDWAGFHRYAQNALSDWPGSLLAVTARDGQLVVNSAVPFGTPLPNLWEIEARHGEADWNGRRLPLSSQGTTRRVFEVGGVHYSNLYVAVALRRPTLAVAMPAGQDYAVTMSFPTLALQQLLERAATADDLRAVLIDRSNTIVVTNGRSASVTGDESRDQLFRPHAAAPDVSSATGAASATGATGAANLVIAASQPPALPAASQLMTAAPMGLALPPGTPASGVVEFTSRDGTPVVVAWAYSELNGYRVLTALPREQAYAAATSLLKSWGAVVAGVLLLGILFSGMLAARMQKGLQHLAWLAQQRLDGTSDEATLQAAGSTSGSGASSLMEIDTAVQALQGARQAERVHRQVELARRLAEEQRATLAASQDRLRRIVDNLFVFVGLVDAQGVLIEANQAPLDAAGQSRSDVIGQPFHACAWWSYDHEVSERIRLGVQSALQGKFFRGDETIRVAGDGRMVIDLQLAPLLDAHGQVDVVVASAVDITARVAVEHSLRQADQQKDEFIATLAHELRNPLAPIQAGADMLRLQFGNNPQVARCAAVLLRQTKQLSRLVDDLLDVTRLRLGTLELQPARIDLRDVAQAALETVQPALQQAGHHITVDMPQAPLMLQGDAVRLTQVLSNLLHNACKFTPPGGELHLQIQASDGQAVLTVRDNGCGVAPENLERVFELFTQERPSGLAGQSGLGIGLALARRLLQLHGGQIRAHSDGPGLGSQFIVHLPLLQPATPPLARPGLLPGPVTDLEPATARSVGLGAVQPLEPPDASAGAHRQAAKPTAGTPAGAAAALQDTAAAAAPALCRVLVVDDNLDAAEMMSSLLQMHGHSTGTAANGQQALARWEQESWDVLLLDIGLPDMTGHDVARSIRQRQDAARPTLLVALTGWGQESDRELAMAAGFDAHYTKPADMASLLALLETQTRRSAPPHPAALHAPV